MPRLSVDIDLTYLPVGERAASLAAIDAAMKHIAANIKASIKGASITDGKIEGTVTKLLVRAEGVQIKIEVTPVLRGCVYEPEVRAVSEWRQLNLDKLSADKRAALVARLEEVLSE
jgi:hypothetical protein